MAARTPNRYQLPLISMVGAMAVVLAFIAIGRIWRVATHSDQGVAVQTVDYQGWLKSAKQDGHLHAYAPHPMPKGWRATSASYVAGAVPRWHLGVLTDDKQYVGLDESLQPLTQMVDTYLSDNAKRGTDVTVDGVSWQTWTDSRGDYALARTFKAPKGKYPEHLLVGGSASPSQVRTYAAALR
ncbi:MAG TPA: DUF4245 domain-containing protein [Marmoricola sp.]